MIAAGKLDRKIIIRRETETVTATGAVSKTWADLATVRAEVVENVFAEDFTAYGTAEDGTVVFRIRYRPGITIADRVLYAGRTFDLKEVVEIGRRAGLELRNLDEMTHLRGRKPAVAPDKDPLKKAPPAPKWMSKEARAEWKRVLPGLVARGVITDADLPGIENYCLAMGRVREIEVAFNVQPLDKVLFGMQNRAIQTARQLAAEYGLSPVSRSRVGSLDADEDDDDNPLSVT